MFIISKLLTVVCSVPVQCIADDAGGCAAAVRCVGGGVGAAVRELALL